MKSIIIVFAAMMLILATPFIFDIIDDAQTSDITQNNTNVNTGAGVYTANVTLSQPLWKERITSVKAISSNLTGADAPTAFSYNSVSHSLEVSGLVQSANRTLSIDYYIDSTTLPSGMVNFFLLIRWFWVLIPLGMCGGAIYAFFD